MGKYSQTLARIGAGLTVMGALTWLLWGGFDPSGFDPEPIFTFLVAFVVWVSIEFKNPEGLGALEPTDHDVRVGRRLVELHQHDLRYLLHDAHLWTFVEADIYRKMWELIEDWDRGKLFFSHKGLQLRLSNFVHALKDLSLKIATDTTEEKVGGEWMIGYKPTNHVTEEEYDRLMSESKVADSMADNSWNLFEELIQDIRVQIPTAYSAL